jgi:hypothetical protein
VVRYFYWALLLPGKLGSSFSEEKEAKRLLSPRCGTLGVQPQSWNRRRNKSFLVLFFKKELLS